MIGVVIREMQHSLRLPTTSSNDSTLPSLGKPQIHSIRFLSGFKRVWKMAQTCSDPTGEVNMVNGKVMPGGMLFQKREDDDNRDGGASSCGNMIKINVSHGSAQHEVNVTAQSTFGDLKSVIAKKIGLEPKDQRVLFRGKEKEDEEHLHIAGVKDKSKVLLLEIPASKENKVEEVKKSNGMSKASEAVTGIRAEVDKLSERVAALEVAVHGGTKVSDKEFVVPTELLMGELLKLDSIEAEGEVKMQRKAEVRRVQNFVETLDTLKEKNSNQFSNGSNAVSVTTNWETFDSGVGSLGTQLPMSSSMNVTEDWEQFD